MVVSGSLNRWDRWHIIPQKARTISGIIILPIRGFKLDFARKISCARYISYERSLFPLGKKTSKKGEFAIAIFAYQRVPVGYPMTQNSITLQLPFRKLMSWLSCGFDMVQK